MAGNCNARKALIGNLRPDRDEVVLTAPQMFLVFRGYHITTKREEEMANETMRMSAAGMSELRRRKSVVLRYYNDSANNCTFGAGSLAHRGGCTAEELSRTVTVAEVNASLALRVASAEQTVRRRVNRHSLTQEQFDALVSFTFNAGATGARRTLDAADRGSHADVATHMTNHVFIHPRDGTGRRGRAVRSPGLVNRRREEVTPFQPTPARR